MHYYLLDCEDVESDYVRHDEGDEVGVGRGKPEGITEVVKDELVDNEVSQGNSHGEAKSSKNYSSVLHVFLPVDELEETDHKADNSSSHRTSQVDLSHSEMTVERVIKRRKHTPSNQQGNACEVESQQQAVGF